MEPMNHPRQSALQRIQVGLIGLVVVLLFVSIANMALEKAGFIQGSTPSGGGITGTEIATEAKAAPTTPLTELGVTPVVGGSATGKPKPAPSQTAPQ